MAPIISVVGRSGSGKTTLIEKLIAELKTRGYRTATIKHTPMGVNLGDKDKDTRRHLEAGAEATIAAGPDELVLVKPARSAPSLEELARLFGEECDLVIAEGFKQDDAPKIEVHRKAIAPPLTDLKKLVAIATDEPLDTKARQFGLDDTKPIADLLEDGFIKPQRERILMYADNSPITLTMFPREIVTNLVAAVAASLKGAGSFKLLKIIMKRE